MKFSDDVEMLPHDGELFLNIVGKDTEGQA